jgi:hypothetical protein
MRVDKVRSGADETKGGRKGTGVEKALQQHSLNCTHESEYDRTVSSDVSFRKLKELEIRT